MTSTWPESLLISSVYPHAIDSPRLIETHISWVVLTGTFAYKLKKPVNLGFLDFTTLEQRRHYCEREIRLNRRFSQDLYLDVVPVTGTREHPRIDGKGKVIDYAVRMHQFDNRQLADKLAQDGRLNDDLVQRMGRTLARIHDELPAMGTNCKHGSADNFYTSAMQNFSQMRAYPLPDDIVQALSAHQQWLEKTWQSCRQLLEDRHAQGFVKDCHGDCHLGNIVILEGEVTLFDCIEFNDSFRIGDTMAEAAFLSMDLCARDLPEQSWLFLNTYLEHRGDYDALPLLNLYRCYYAIVRAKVSLLNKPAAETPVISAETQPEFYRYLELAGHFTARQSPVLILMHGLSGSGKSWLAQRVTTATGAIRIRSDVERKRLFNLQPEQSGAAVAGLYSRQASRKTFDRLLGLAQSIIDAGFRCVVDATFLTERARSPFLEWAIGRNIPYVILQCKASEPVILSRLRQRCAERSDSSDADIEVYKQQKSYVQPFSTREQPYLLSVNTERSDCVDFVIAEVANRM